MRLPRLHEFAVQNATEKKRRAALLRGAQTNTVVPNQFYYVFLQSNNLGFVTSLPLPWAQNCLAVPSRVSSDSLALPSSVSFEPSLAFPFTVKGYLGASRLMLLKLTIQSIQINCMLQLFRNGAPRTRWLRTR